MNGETGDEASGLALPVESDSQAMRNQRVVMMHVLDDIEVSIRASDFERLAKVAFVWSQRRDHLLDGEETWKHQNIGPVVFGRAFGGSETD